MPSKNDFEFGRIAVESKFLSKEQLQDGIFYQVELEKTGRRISLERILFLSDFITDSQILKIQTMQKRRIFYCVDCQTKINAWGFEVGVEIKCPKCSTVFVVPDSAFLDWERASFVDIKKQIDIIRQQKGLSGKEKKWEEKLEIIHHESQDPTVNVNDLKTAKKKEEESQKKVDETKKSESKIQSVKKFSRLAKYKKEDEKKEI